MCVVFVIGDDIVEKLIALHKRERMNFILGYLDNDYFNDHYLAIEELNEYWKDIFYFFSKQEEFCIDFIKYGEFLTDKDSDFVLLLIKNESVRDIARRLNDLNPMQLGKLYSTFLSQNKIDDHMLDFIDFLLFIRDMRDVCNQAVKTNSSLLFSLDH